MSEGQKMCPTFPKRPEVCTSLSRSPLLKKKKEKKNYSQESNVRDQESQTMRERFLLCRRTQSSGQKATFISSALPALKDPSALRRVGRVPGPSPEIPAVPSNLFNAVLP